MTTSTSCPDRASLELLLEKGGAPEEIDRLAAHVEICVRCGDTVESLLAADQTAAVLRGAKVEADESSIQLLRVRLAKLRPAAAVAAARDDTFGENVTLPPAADASGSQTEADAVFLAPARNADEIGRLSHYRVLKKLGAGGMGVVFLAEDTLLGRKVALKTMLPSIAANPQSRERFFREARAAAALEHANVVAIFQVGEDRGVPYLAMPFLKGEPLDERLKRQGKLNPFEAARIAVEMAEGLAAAHVQGLIHRDIKPGNVWLEGERGQVKLLDFGLARSQADETHLTQQGAILGTPAYMAPEQARCEAVDGRADLFSLGCVLYFMLTGKRPFAGDSIVSQLMSLAMDTPPAPHEVEASVPRSLGEFTMRLLEKDPAARPASAKEASAELRRIVREETQATAAPEERSFTDAKGYVRSVAFAPDGKTVAAAYAEKSVVRVWDVTEAELKERTVLKGSCEPLAFAPDGKTLACCPAPVPNQVPNAVALWDLSGAEPKRSENLYEEPNGWPRWSPTSLAFGPDGKNLACATYNGCGTGKAWLWDLAAAKPRVRDLPAQGMGDLCSVAFAPDGKSLAAAGNSGKVILWDAATRKKLRSWKLPGEVGSIAFAPDGRHLFLGNSNGTVYVLRLGPPD